MEVRLQLGFTSPVMFRFPFEWTKHQQILRQNWSNSYITKCPVTQGDMERFWNPPTPCGSRSPCALRRKDECRFSRIFQIELASIYPNIMIRLPEKGYNPAFTRSEIGRDPVLG